MVDRPSNEPASDRRLPITITRTRSGQRMWSDPVVPAPNRLELTQQHQHQQYYHPHHAFGPAHYTQQNYPREISSDRTVISPVAAAICRDIPLRPLPSTLMAHYRNGGAHLINHGSNSDHLGGHHNNSNVISSIHDLNLYEDDPQGYDAYATHSVPRLMRQAPKLLSLDDYNLISLGYKPVMARRLPWVTVAGVALTATNVFSGVIPLYGLALTNGGPAWATWSFLVVGLMSFAVTLCLSELASAYPTTAGVHHWVYQLGSARRRAYLSWMVGWFTIVSAVAVTASVAFYFSSVLGQLLLSLHKISITPATLVMFHLGVLFAWQTINLIPIRPIGYLSIFSGVFMVALAVALISVMLSLTGIDPSMAHVPFTAVLNYSGSSSAVYAALSSTLMASFVFCPQDTIIRMAEESRRPERSLPKLMVGSTISSLLIGLPLVIVLNYGIIKTIRGLLDESVPGIRIILSTIGDSIGTVFVAFVLTAIFFTGLMRLSTATRTVYSFSRDGGVPHSSYWNHLHPRRKIPQRVSWLVTIACMCCIFPFFWGNTIAFQWISSLGCIAANISFIVPLWMRLTREGKLHFIPGNFTLGRFSKALHLISIVWLTFQSLILMLPSTVPVSKNNFNYAPVVLAILTVVFAVSWSKARTDFTGGAKDVSRASHRIPSRALEDIYPRKSPSPALTPPRDLPPFHQPPSDETVQRFKSPLDKRARNGNGHNKVLPDQTTAVSRPGYPTSLNPPRRDPIPSSSTSKEQNLQQHHPTAGAGPSSRSNPRDQFRGQAPNMTTNTVTSVQSHPDSILGIPFTESPEMMYRELSAQESSSSPSPSPPEAGDLAADTHSPVRSSAESSGLFLTRPFGPTIAVTDAAIASGIVPEISIAPPTTNSSVIESARATPRRQSPPPRTLSSRTAQKAPRGASFENKVVASQPSAQGSTNNHPLSAIDSIFKLGQGLSNMFTSGKGKVTASMNSAPSNTNRLRTGKNRAPTPYPGSLVDPTEDSAVSDYAASMMDDSRAPMSLKTVLKLSPPSPPLHQQGRHGSSSISDGVGGTGGYDDKHGRYSIEDIVNNTSISMVALPSISQFPTLDGYPLIKSPSTMDFVVESSANNKTGGGGGGGEGGGSDAGRRPSNTTIIRPLMLPLSRTPTIQATSQAYTQSSLDERDLEEQLGEADEAYENEYHRDYPVISISNNRLQSLSPTSPIAVGGIGTLFRLPNRDIGASTSSPALTPSGGIIHSSSLMTHSTGPAATPTTVIAPLGGASNQQHQQHNQQSTQHHHNHHGNASERHDPIERLLLLKAQQEGDTTSQQQLESANNPALQFLQRTRTVANWAQEQSRIQEKRERHYARARALKELRKHDPTATLSVHSESSSSFSDFSSLSSFPTSTSSSASTSKFVPVTSSQQRHHRQQQQQQQQQYSAQVRAPPSSSLPKEKLIVNTNFGEGLSSSNAGGGTNGKMPSFSRHFNTSLVVDPTLMEDIQLDQPTRLEMLIQEEDEEDEEEPGLYIDTDDVLSPSMEIESLGAGVGRL